MNRLDQTSSDRLRGLEKLMYELPSGTVEESTAPKIEGSRGKKTWRLSIDGLDDRAKIAILKRFGPSRYVPPPGYNYALVHLRLSEQEHDDFDGYNMYRNHKEGWSEGTLFVNINSLKKRLELPKCLSFGGDIIDQRKQFSRVIQLVRDRSLFQIPREEEGPVDKQGGLNKPLLPIGTLVHSLVPQDQMVKIAQLHNRSYRLSKHLYNMKRSMHVLRDGFIATDGGEILRVYDEVFHEKEKISLTPQGERVVRRTAKVVGYGCDENERRASGIRTHKIFSQFKGKVGILNTYSTDFYINKKGTIKLVSFHPEFKNTLFDLVGWHSVQDPVQKVRIDPKWEGDLPTEKDKMQIAHQLLKGMNEIALLGDYRGLNQYSVRIRKVGNSFEAVICDLQERFRGRRSPDSWLVWDMGTLIFHLFSKHHYPKYCFAEIDQQEIDALIKICKLPPKVEVLVLGMAHLDPKKRWTAEQCLKFFDEYMESQPVPVIEEQKQEE